MGLEFYTSRVGDAINWARKFSLFQYPFVTACCGMEFMSVAGPRFDVSRFGAEAPRFSPRQADLIWVVGTISQHRYGNVRFRDALVIGVLAAPAALLVCPICDFTEPSAHQCWPFLPAASAASPRAVRWSPSASSASNTRDGVYVVGARSLSLASVVTFPPTFPIQTRAPSWA